jgi:hypothetical protein
MGCSIYIDKGSSARLASVLFDGLPVLVFGFLRFQASLVLGWL